MSNFLSWIENTDPGDPSLSKDDTGSCWGHYQFTSGGMRITSVMQSWDCVRGTAVACKLIAAAIKTCKVTCHIFWAEHQCYFIPGRCLSLEPNQRTLWHVGQSRGGKFNLNLHCAILNDHRHWSWLWSPCQQQVELISLQYQWMSTLNVITSIHHPRHWLYPHCHHQHQRL